MKFLNGAELAGFIKERQAKQVRALRQAYGVYPKLAIITTSENPTIDIYIKLKKAYGEDILIDVDVYRIKQTDAKQQIIKLNNDPSVHGIIVQLPLENPAQTDEILQAVDPQKDVDGLGLKPLYDLATPTAINWLLTGYNISMESQNIVIIGKGRLVGAPLYDMWRQSSYQVTALDVEDEIAPHLKHATVIVSATGQPNLLTSTLIPVGAVVVDAGTSVENGTQKGDLADDVYERDDLTVTPRKGGVGPLTVAALFENVIRAARSTIST
jgi:methylenetetrahydrofolate dehydrogenase (NADP+)/methenyltetrahydrofolate cyclohydrolase